MQKFGGRAARRAMAGALVACAAAAPQAQAATIEVGKETIAGQEVTYLAAIGRDGADDKINVFQDGAIVKFSVFYGGDSFDVEQMPEGCEPSKTAIHNQQADCDLTQFDGIQAVAAVGLGGNDEIRATNDGGSVTAPFLTFGGEGADTLVGGVGLDIMLGEGGNDSLSDTAGPDLMSGGAGDDGFFSGISGEQDVMDGGDGIDNAVFKRGREFTVSLNAAADDGIAGENDDVRVENLGVEDGGATFVGDDGPNVFTNVIFGGEGGRKNRFEGRGGDDRLLGGGGRDEVIGGDGADELVGGDDSDLLDGGAGVDSFLGDTRSARYDERPGDDEILAADGVQETISCGMGSDRATVDAGDVVSNDLQNTCEAVTRVGGEKPDAKVDLGTGGLGLKTGRRDRKAPFAFKLRGKLDAPAAACAGASLRLTVHRGRKRVKRTTVAVGGDCSWRATIKLPRKGRYVLRAQSLGGPGLNASPKAQKIRLRAG